ncbi:hypothetical protein BTVI_124523 [Pitangus sulphuratus]|nr:hypothetical protein BTVI_124523 [Pitangus sulphuratus]
MIEWAFGEDLTLPRPTHHEHMGHALDLPAKQQRAQMSSTAEENNFTGPLRLSSSLCEFEHRLQDMDSQSIIQILELLTKIHQQRLDPRMQKHTYLNPCTSVYVADNIKLLNFRNLVRFNKAKYKVLRQSQGNAQYQYRLEDEWTEKPCQEGLGGTGE